MHENVALVREEQTDHVLDAHRLAGTGWTEDHRDLVVWDAEVEPVQDRVAPEGLLDVDELDRVLAAVVSRLARMPAVLLLGAVIALPLRLIGRRVGRQLVRGRLRGLAPFLLIRAFVLLSQALRLPVLV